MAKKKLTLTYTLGLPASGKDTWADEQVRNGNGNVIKVNKDELRAMLHAKQHSKDRERFVCEVRDSIIIAALEDGKNVISSDTNLHQSHPDRFKEIAKEFNNKHNDAWVEVVCKDLTDVSKKTCIERDAKRGDKSVGEKVINRMYNDYLKKPWVPLEQNENLPQAIIVDIDGTLAHMGDKRGPYDWHKVGEDSRDYAIGYLVDVLEQVGFNIILVSGRDAVCRAETEKWLEDKEVEYVALFMRPEGDQRKDNIVKEEIFNNHIRNKYNVIFVLDDRNQVVEMWRSLGLKCLQVADGDF